MLQIQFQFFRTSLQSTTAQTIFFILRWKNIFGNSSSGRYTENIVPRKIKKCFDLVLTEDLFEKNDFIC